jgi:outer membrane lipoprotein-sorting protein
MVRCVSAALIALLFVLPVSLAARQSADDIVGKHLAAKGGLERLKAITTIRQTTEMVREGTTMRMVVAAKRPNLTRQELTVNGKTIVQIFDGTSAWMINPFMGSTEPVALTGPEADMTREQSTFDSPLVDYQGRGTTVEIVGTEEVGGRRAHHLKVTSKTGQIQHVYIDTETFLESRVTTETPKGTVDQYFSDFRDVNGVKIPFAIKTNVAAMGAIDIKVLKVEVNPALDDSLFKVK